MPSDGANALTADEAEEFFFDQLADWFSKHTATRRRDMPSNIALDLRRALERSSLTLVHVDA